MRRGLIIGGAGAIGIGGLWWGSDRLIGGLYEGVKPRLENQIGKVLGHPLKLGPYRGLGVDGLRLGPSRILEGRHDRSSVSARSVTVLVDPLTSLRTRTLMLDLSFAGARADLRRNAKGQFWVLGTMPPGGEPPPLDLTFRLLQPARVKLWGLGPSPSPLALNATGRVGMQLKRSAMDLRARLAFPGVSGSASIQGTGQWKRNRWKADLRLQRLALEPLAMLLPASGSRPEEGSAPALGGHAEGRVKLSLDQGQADCRGDLTVRRLNLRPGAGPSRLRVGSLPLRCRDRELEVAESDWTFSGWRGRLAARLSADRRLALLLEARPPRGHALGRSAIQTSLRGRWQDGALSKLRFRGRRGTSQIVLRGSLGSDLDLKGGWRLSPGELPGTARLAAGLIIHRCRISGSDPAGCEPEMKQLHNFPRASGRNRGHSSPF